MGLTMVFGYWSPGRSKCSLAGGLAMMTETVRNIDDHNDEYDDDHNEESDYDDDG